MHPFYGGITFATLSLSGKIPVVKDLLISITSAEGLSNLIKKVA